MCRPGPILRRVLAFLFINAVILTTRGETGPTNAPSDNGIDGASTQRPWGMPAFRTDVPQPDYYNEPALAVLLRSKLTPDEKKLVVNPLASTPEMDGWARRITAGATNDDAKAQLLFRTLADRSWSRGTLNTIGAMRITAQDVFPPGKRQTRLSFARIMRCCTSRWPAVPALKRMM